MSKRNKIIKFEKHTQKFIPANKGKFNQRSKQIDQQILMVAKFTQGQLPIGVLAQITKINNV